MHGRFAFWQPNNCAPTETLAQKFVQFVSKRPKLYLTVLVAMIRLDLSLQSAMIGLLFYLHFATLNKCMYKIVFTKEAVKVLRKMSRNLAHLLRQKLAELASDPYLPTNATKLQNRPSYRLQVGDWRVTYELQDEQLVVLVLNIGPRGEVYR